MKFFGPHRPERVLLRRNTPVCRRSGRGPCREGVWPLLDAWGVVGLRATVSVWNAATSCEKVVGLEAWYSGTACRLPRRKVSNVENFMSCSFAHHACSPLLQESLHEEGLCKVTLTCHFSLDVLFLCQD